MICSLTLDLDDSPDFPGSEGSALGRPLPAYPLIAAKSTRFVRRHYVVTEAPAVKAVALQYGAHIVDPPRGAAPPRRVETLLLHGLRLIQEELKSESAGLDFLALLFANAPTVTGEIIDEGLEALQARPELDSAASVSCFNRFHPGGARRQNAQGLLEPYAPSAAGADDEVWFFDRGVQVLRPKALEAMEGPAPFPWLGRKVLALKQWGGGPVDYQWQIPALEHWLTKHGVSDLSSKLELQPQPKLQPAPKGRG